MENYQVIRKIGSGNFAKVYLAVHSPTGRKVALKVIEKRAVSTSKKLFLRVRREISNLKKLRHSNVVEIYESFETRSQFVIAMEYLPNGELFDYVWKKQGLGETEARELFRQIVEGVNCCHRNSVVHRDLKLENILLDANGQPKLADFGFSKEVDREEFLETYCGSPLYASPEMILGRPYFGTECDVWSLGVILYTMLTATMPFDDRNIPSFLSCVENGVYPEPSGVSEMAKDLLSKMLNPHPLSRASVEDVLSHPWLQQQQQQHVQQPPHKVQKQRSRHLTRHPAKPSLCSETTAGSDSHSQPLPEHCCCVSSCHSKNTSTATQKHSSRDSSCPKCSNSRSVKSHKPIIRKNSSGYSSGYASDLPSPAGPLSIPSSQ